MYSEQARLNARVRSSQYYYANREAILARERQETLERSRALAEKANVFRSTNPYGDLRQLKGKRGRPRFTRNEIKKRYKLRKRSDPLYRLKVRLAKQIRAAFKKCGYTKRSSCGQLLGADFASVKTHLETLFQPGMNWENRGAWHIDHVIPLASAKSEARLIELFNYKNLQPLWARDNCSKGAKYAP